MAVAHEREKVHNFNNFAVQSSKGEKKEKKKERKKIWTRVFGVDDFTQKIILHQSTLDEMKTWDFWIKLKESSK